MSKVTQGSCLCGSIKYQVDAELKPVCACHCTQCRKTSGHYVAATSTLSKHLTITGDSLQWYRSSDTAERGFCNVCGSNLFWRPFGEDRTSIFAGSIDGPTGLRMETQLYPDNKGDYYDLPDAKITDQSEHKKNRHM